MTLQTQSELTVVILAGTWLIGGMVGSGPALPIASAASAYVNTTEIGISTPMTEANSATFPHFSGVNNPSGDRSDPGSFSRASVMAVASHRSWTRSGRAGTRTFDEDVQQAVHDAHTGAEIGPVWPQLQAKAMIDALEAWDKKPPASVNLS